MKGKALLLILLIIGGYLYMSGYIKVPDNLSPDRIINTAKSLGSTGGTSTTPASTSAISSTTTSSETAAKDLNSTAPEPPKIENISVSNSGNETLIRFEAPVLDEDLLGIAYELAKKAYEVNGSENVRVEAYFRDEPILALTTENGDFDNPVFEDIRRPEFKIETDLGLFDVLVHNVTVTNETALVSLEYLAGNESFWRDYVKMSLAILEDAPWVKTVEITYVGDKNVSVSVPSKAILEALSGKLSPEEFANSISVAGIGKG
ncbi:hypothetical protein [Thermococcus sp.]|uniref:hypothetical protein n=1 Tax=Thermococcus sp. TaxID=35749 RepID=UPI0025F5DCF5|nr:hypothetical protein [Thermococcus sp.]